MKNINIDVHHVTRVEGHGNIVVNVTNGKLEKCEWKVVESPRFFEAMVRGRHYSEVPRITSRICGICSVGHTLASLKATENALGMEITEQTTLLRRILKHAENFDSNILHVCFLAAPDFLGAKSVFPLAVTHTEVVKIALRLKRLGHEWGSTIGGRTTHPTKASVPGGFGYLPTETELKELKKKILDRIPDVENIYKVLLSVADKIPNFTRETEYVCLIDSYEYGLYDGVVGCMTPDGMIRKFEVKDYKTVTNEWVSPLSTAKYTKHLLDSYMVGALARININFNRLHDKAKEIAKGFGFKPLCTNPFMNTVAQFIEAVHNAYTTVEYIDKVLSKGIKDEKPVPPTKFSLGAGATEVPRGILFHEYEYDKDGFCTYANCIIPTNQNHANIQKDFEKIVPEMISADKNEKEMEHTLEMLVRAYDPCISCSTHYLDVEFKK